MTADTMRITDLQPRPTPAEAGTAPTPHPIGRTLPALYLDDSLAQRFCAALDRVLGPSIVMLDSFPAYLDPRTTPPDVLAWLASWVGLPAVESLPAQRCRELVARAAELHAARGTPQAIQDLVELVTGVRPEVLESGGCTASVSPRTPLPGRSRAELVIQIRGVRPAPDPVSRPGAGPPPDEHGEGVPSGGVDPALLIRLLLLVAPAHLPWTVEFR